MGLFGDIEGAWDEVTSGANTAPTPQVSTSPPAPVQPRTWTAPSVNPSGHLTVHHGALTSAASVIKNYVNDLENAIEAVNQQGNAFDSLMGWDTGSSFGGNLVNAVTAFLSAGNDTSQAHATAAGHLNASQATYADTETTNAQLPSRGGSPSGSAGSPGTGGSSGTGSSGSGSSGSGSSGSGWGH